MSRADTLSRAQAASGFEPSAGLLKVARRAAIRGGANLGPAHLAELDGRAWIMVATPKGAIQVAFGGTRAWRL